VFAWTVSPYRSWAMPSGSVATRSRSSMAARDFRPDPRSVATATLRSASRTRRTLSSASQIVNVVVVVMCW